MEELERVVMARLLAADSAVAPLLRAQYAVARVEQRAFTGVGFFTDFAVPPDAPSVVPPDLTVGAGATLADGTAVGFLLFVRGGVLSMLEGYTYGDDPWPESARLGRWEEAPPRGAG